MQRVDSSRKPGDYLIDEPSLIAGLNAVAAGGVIAYPTEAVWGLGCDPFSEAAVSKLLQIKNRPVEKGLILVAASLDQLPALASSLTATQRRTLEETWPGPVTWLIPDPEGSIPNWIKGEHESVAVRVSAHPLVRELCDRHGGALVSTSANDAGEPEIRSQSRLTEEFGGRIDAVIAGELGDSTETSQIRDLISGNRLR
ncbi:MAG: Sua5/YciO/YrdC/YwlC family protein [Proteobacteria bacterium]|nr:Sua5/YciO/YrdC/YwlC family protein [Pseudomonadota bacterium]MDA1243975.1 Sua5/YciO/YrdC/YwlC family protein [Pseudomonadota bacterium]